MSFEDWIPGVDYPEEVHDKCNERICKLEDELERLRKSFNLASAVKAAERASVALEESQGDVPSSQRAEILRETALVQANIAIAQALIALAVGQDKEEMIRVG